MKFSIIIPVYNSSNYIIRCLDSIKKQIYNNFECIIIDDGSTDNSFSICNDYIKSDSRFKIIHQENKGVSVARNAGLNAVTGDYIVFVDSDDFIELNLLQELNETIQESSNAIVQYGFFGWNNDSKTRYLYNNPSFDVKAGNMGVVWRHAFPADLIGNLRFDEKLSGGEDYLFVNEALSKINNIVLIKKCLYNHFFDNTSSIMNNISIDLLKQQVDSTNKVINLYKSNMDRETISALKIRKEWCKIELIQYTLNLFDEKPSKLRKIWRKIIRKISLKLA